MNRIKPVIMAGGAGTRLWPLSRKLFPKQFIKLFDGQSLLQKTLLRNKSFGRPCVIVGEEHKFIAAEQIREIDIQADLIVESIPKDTAPCAIIASLIAQHESIETVLLLPADHHIDENDRYLSVINKSFNYADHVATVGIKPTHPHTGYGYIKAKNSIAHKIFEAKEFVEKPNFLQAQTYLAEGNYFWNSGIFIFNANYMLEQTQLLQGKLFEQVQTAYTSASKDLNFVRLNDKYYRDIESISVDYAVMENIKNMILLEADFTWNDLGNWNSIWETSTKDAQNNHLTSDVIVQDVNNSYIMSDKRLTAVIGLDNIVIINTSDTLLVADKSKSEEIKHIVNHLNEFDRREINEYTRVFKPWGYYQTIDDGELYRVKKIVVHSGQKLSLESHNHRAEHWIVVRGTAEVTIGNATSILAENDSIYTPQGSTHRLCNNGDADLHLIEVQTGQYLGEDDIVRLGDNYGRK